METEIAKAGAESVRKAAAVIKSGGVVAFPTETVYGLGANALDPEAVDKIFAAKGRPADNPLIVHVADLDGVYSVAREVPDSVAKLIKRLGPAPLTYVLNKTDAVPKNVTAGLSTVAVRLPAHETALKLIRETGLPLAAPSANSSGRPSPTSASHVYDDLKGRIPLILDGGPCAVGVESTVVDFTGKTPAILRPGGFGREYLEELLDCRIPLFMSGGDKAVKSPGMKYKHYSPKCKIVTVPYTEDVSDSLKKAYDNHVQTNEKPVIICQTRYFGESDGRIYIPLGETAEDAARSIFRLFRENEDKYGVLICQMLPDHGIGRAYNDRLSRAASRQESAPETMLD